MYHINPFTLNSLQRFLDAQKNQYYIALREMREGSKRSHWIWFIFPQIQGLGQSPESKRYGISDLDEAKAYLSHPVLGVRLREITAEVLKHTDSSIRTIMGGGIDVKKFKSSMTLFDAVSPNDIFAKALETFYGGERDNKTLEMITL